MYADQCTFSPDLSVENKARPISIRVFISIYNSNVEVLGTLKSLGLAFTYWY
jgi:hypothetical protein